MEGFGAGRLVVLARWRSLILESGSAPFAVLLTVGTLVCRAIVVGPIVIGSLAVHALGVFLVVKVVGMGFNRVLLVWGVVAVVVSWGKVGLGLQWEGFVGLAQLVVISRMYFKVSPPSGEVAVLKVGRVLVFLVLVLVGLGLKKGCKVEVVWRLVRRVWRSRCLLGVS